MSSVHRKRPFAEDSLHIRLAAAADSAADGDPLVADRGALVACSSCVRGLPADASEWDVSKLLIDGQPVQKQTVVAWLNKVYELISDEPFEHQEDNPSNTFSGLARLLAFADAVGSSRGLLRSCVSSVDDLLVVVQLPGQAPASQGVQQQPQAEQAEQLQQVQFSIGTGYWWVTQHPLVLNSTKAGIRSVGTSARKAAAVQQVAQETEALLYLAYRLQLPVLQQKLVGFIRMNTNLRDSLLFGSLGSVLSDRVLDAAADKATIKQLQVNNIVLEQGGMIQPYCHSQPLFTLVSVEEGTAPVQLVPLKVKARLHRDAFGCRKGDVVDVKLALFGDNSSEEPYIKINNTNHVVQLQIGPMVWSQESMQLLMGPACTAAGTLGTRAP